MQLTFLHLLLLLPSLTNAIPLWRSPERKKTPVHSLLLAKSRHNLTITALENHPDVQLVNHADALYTATVSFGNNQTFQVDLDTGSSDVWIRGSMCTSWPWDNSCGIFKRSLDTRDETLERTKHTWKTKYGSGSVHGHVYRGPVTLGGVTADLNFGVSVRERGFQSTGDGLWGLAYPAINQIEGGNWVQAAGIKSFAFYFSDNVNGDFGELTINGVDETKFTGEIQYVPLIEETYYEFAPDGSFVINDVEIPMTGTRAIADTGTSLMLLPDDISDQVNQAIGATFVHHFGLYIIPCSAAKTGPAITINIGQASIVLTASEYILDGGNGQDCVSGISKIGNLAHGGRSPQYILGDTFLRAAYSVHDIENKRIGFAQAVHPKGDKGLVGAGGVVNHEALLAQAAADRIVDDIKQGFNDVKESIKNFVSGDKEEDKGASL